MNATIPATLERVTVPAWFAREWAGEVRGWRIEGAEALRMARRYPAHKAAWLEAARRYFARAADAVLRGAFGSRVTPIGGGR